MTSEDRNDKNIIHAPIYIQNCDSVLDDSSS